MNVSFYIPSVETELMSNSKMAVKRLLTWFNQWLSTTFTVAVYIIKVELM